LIEYTACIVCQVSVREWLGLQ